MFDSCKISEDMLEDFIMSFGGFCHITRALIYRIANLWPWVANSLQLKITQENGTIQRHKKMALLRGSFTDEEERDKD